MRERLALLLCLVTLVLVVGLAAWFAQRHNPPASVPAAVAPEVKNGPAVSPGAALLRDHGCTSCHSFRGTGNPRYPLDGVGDRRSPDELRAWITGTGVAATQLAGSVVRRKERYTELPPAEMAAIVAYLGDHTEAAR
jgi:hypothetical protein